MKNNLPGLRTSGPSLQSRKEDEFDRLLLLVFELFLVAQKIPEVFLKSYYFTTRPLLIQLFTEDPQRFRVLIEEPQSEQDFRQAIGGDYKTLDNSINQPFSQPLSL